MRAQLSTLMSQVGSNLRLSQLHPLRPSHTDQSQGSISVEPQPEGMTKSTIEVGDPTGTPPKNEGKYSLHQHWNFERERKCL